jgi:hypothetical protein
MRRHLRLGQDARELCDLLRFEGGAEIALAHVAAGTGRGQ